MRLSPEQVQENNVYVRNVLTSIIEHIKLMERQKRIKDEVKANAKFWERVIIFFATDPREEMVNIELLQALKILKMQIAFYLKTHYTTGGQLTQFMSPKLSFTTEVDHILWRTVYKHTLSGVPHIVK